MRLRPGCDYLTFLQIAITSTQAVGHQDEALTQRDWFGGISIIDAVLLNVQSSERSEKQFQHLWYMHP